MNLQPIIFLLAFIAFTHSAFGQDKKLTYQYWRSEGIKEYKAQNFDKAIKYFRLAETLSDAPVDNDIDNWIEKSFDGYVILLKEAERKAKLEAKASEMAGLAYKLGKSNPTHGIRIAEAALQLGTNSKSAKQQFHDLLSQRPSPFYAQCIEHPHFVGSVAVLDEGAQILTGCWDGVIRAWNSSGDLEQKFDGHSAEVLDIAISPDGSAILSGSSDNTAILWNRKGKMIQKFTGHVGDVSAVCFSPDGKQLATASWDKTIKVWDIDGQMVRSFEAHEEFIADLDYSPDGQYLVSGGWDKLGKVWRVDGTLLTTLRGHKGALTSVCFSPDGNQLLTGSWDEMLHLWSLDGTVLQTFDGHEGPVTSADFLEGGSRIVSVSEDLTARLWNINGNEMQVFRFHKEEICDVAVADSTALFVTGGYDSHALVWNYAGAELASTKYDTGLATNTIAVSPDGRTILAGYQNGDLVWYSRELKKQHRDTSHTNEVMALACSADGHLMASGSKDNSVRLWNTQNKECIYKFDGHKSPVYSVMFTPDSKRVLSGEMRGTIFLWNLKGDTLATFKGHRSRVYALDISPNGDRVVSSSRDGTIRVWDTKGQQLKMFIGHDKAYVRDVRFSPDGRFILSGGDDNKAIIRDLNGNIITTFEGHEGTVLSVAFAQEGKSVITSSSDENIKIWDRFGDELQTLSGHKESVLTIACDESDKQVYSVSRDRTVKKWMPWWEYVNSDLISTLTDQEKSLYKLNDAPSPVREEPDEKAEKLKASPIIPSIELYARIRENRKSIYNEYYATFYYSGKAYESQHPIERIYFQRDAINRALFAFSNLGSVSEQAYGVLAYYYANLAIWHAANSELESAVAAADSCLLLHGEEFVMDFLGGKAAIVYWLNGEEEKAKSLLTKAKRKVLENFRSFPNLRIRVTSQVTEPGTTVVDILSADLKYLKNNGCDPEVIAIINQELNKQP